MALTSMTMGKTLTTTGGNIQIWGAPFNPYIVDGTISGMTNTISDGGTVSLSGLQYGHEVILAYGVRDETGGHYIEFTKGGTILFMRSYSGFSNVFVYIGIDYDEIISNGNDYIVNFGSLTYSSDEGYYGLPANSGNYIDAYLSPIFYGNVNVGDVFSIVYYDYIGSTLTYREQGTGTLSSKSDGGDRDRYTFSGMTTPAYPVGGNTLAIMYVGKVEQGHQHFIVSNMPTVNEQTSGYIWVEGDYIHFIDAVKTTTGYEHTIPHDGTSYSTSKTPGMIRVDETNHGKICYVDSSGVERKTDYGDSHGSQNMVESSITGRTPGMIWVSGPSGNYGYLTFVGYDGKGYRIMNGIVAI